MQDRMKIRKKSKERLKQNDVNCQVGLDRFKHRGQSPLGNHLLLTHRRSSCAWLRETTEYFYEIQNNGNNKY